MDFIKKNKKKIIYLAVLTAVTAVLCIVFYNLGNTTAIHRAASKQLRAETAQKQEEHDSLTNEKNSLEEEIKSYKEQAESDSELNVKMKQDEEALTSLNTQIAEAKTTGEALDKQLEEKKSLNSKVNSVSTSVTGQLKTIKPNTYSCPGDIEAGSYTISASEGNIIIYGSNGSVRVSKNLATIDGNEYTINIRDGEKLKIDKTVSIKGSG